MRVETSSQWGEQYVYILKFYGSKNKKQSVEVFNLNPEEAKRAACKSGKAGLKLLLKLGGKQFITLEIFNLGRFMSR